jgi:hypothetical protein
LRGVNVKSSVSSFQAKSANKYKGEPLMASITAIANDFFAACETGKGWEICRAYCAPNATFAAQAEPLADIKMLAEYADWMKGVTTAMPDSSYEVKSFATDTERNNVAAYAVFSALIPVPVVRVSRPEKKPLQTTST